MPNYFYVKRHDENVFASILWRRCFSPPNTDIWYKQGESGTWTQLVFTSSRSDYSESQEISIPQNEKIYFKAGASGNTAFGSYGQRYDNYHNVSFSGDVDIGGDITTLLNENGNVTTLTTSYTFYKLFELRSYSGWQGKINDISDLELTSTTITERCYAYLFCDHSKISVPIKPNVTVLQPSCFYAMYSGCTAITQAFNLDWDVMADSAYGHLFSGTSISTLPTLNYNASLCDAAFMGTFADCLNLVSIPENYLPWTTLAESCYSWMFDGCSNLTNVPNLPATTLAEKCYYYMFQDCTSLDNVPTDLLPATSVPKNGYYGMFMGCTSLTRSPDIIPQATNIATGDYSMVHAGCGIMFRGCRNLHFIKVHTTTWGNSNPFYEWVLNVNSVGIFMCPEELEVSKGTNRIPSTWEVVTFPSTEHGLVIRYDGRIIYALSNVSRQWKMTYNGVSNTYTGSGTLQCEHKLADTNIVIEVYTVHGFKKTLTFPTDHKAIDGTISVEITPVT